MTCSNRVLKTTRMSMAKLLRSYGKVPFPVKDMSNVQTAAESIITDRITPVFSISSVTGQNVELLRKFIAVVRRSPTRYAGVEVVDNDPEVNYERMPGVYFPIDGKQSRRSSDAVIVLSVFDR